MHEQEAWATIAQIAEHYQVGQRTVRRWIAEGQLPAYRVGGLVRIRVADLDKFVRRVASA